LFKGLVSALLQHNTRIYGRFLKRALQTPVPFERRNRIDNRKCTVQQAAGRKGACPLST
jgi:hypothetical protein